MKKTLLQYTNYNLWANSSIIELLKKFPDEFYDKEIKSSFLSIRKTLFHIWDAEFIWLERLNGTSLTTWPSKEYGNETPIEKMLETGRAFVKWTENADEQKLNSETVYSNLEKKQFSTSTSGIIMHIMNHSTFHRGQIVSMIRAAGYPEKIESTDLITFLRK